ncbi:MAG: DNA primase [Candidatus Moranbacteria bacterium]|nr:DNA primase [Candidatus Moranbacteria bacterium]
MNDVEEIKRRLNIVEIVGNYLRLTKSGANHKALCPFHNEKTPSFTVNEERQIFHCFGCGKGGDIFTFIQEIEGMNFVEALKFLAGKAGVSLTQQDSAKTEAKNQLNRVLKAALELFIINLNSKQGEKARAYLQDRGISTELREKFSLGFAKDSWDDIFSNLSTQGFGPKDMEQAGLIVSSQKSRRGYYDRFRNRIIFPVFNSFGDVLGFSARVLPGDDSNMGKYINTPQTPIYDKSRSLYGVNLARNAIKKKDLTILLEGNLDVMLSHKAGVENVVATCGTAVTQDQLAILKRYSDNLAFAFDVDQAGIEAAKKGIDLALSLGLNVGAIDLGSQKTKESKDVADLVLLDENIWKKLADSVKPAMEYYFDMVLDFYDVTNIEERKKAVAELLEKIVLLPHKLDQAYYLEELAQKTGVKLEILYDMIEEKSLSKQASKSPEISKSPKQEFKQKGKSKISQTSNLDKLLNRILALFVFFPQFFTKNHKEQIKKILKSASPSPQKEIFKQILSVETVFSDPNKYLELIESDQLKTRLSRIIMIAQKYFDDISDEKLRTKFDPKKDIEFCIKKIGDLFKKDSLSETLIQIKKAEENQDQELLEELMKKYSRLLKSGF